MQHPFTVLAAEYACLLDAARVTASLGARTAAQRLLADRTRAQFEAVAKATGVPVVWLAATLEREGSGRLDCYLGNGQPLSRVTTIVPKGRGPFVSWADGADDALRLLHLDQVAKQPGGWSLERACYEWEAWNGFGPRAHGVHTGYLWAGTDQYGHGKYVADGKWDPNFADPQLGTVPLMLAMVAIDPALALPRMIAPTIKLVTAPVAMAEPAPAGVGADDAHDTDWLQRGLNKVLKLDPPLIDDGSYGRVTRAAVLEFQSKQGLEVDGLAGPQTIAALTAKLAA